MRFGYGVSDVSSSALRNRQSTASPGSRGNSCGVRAWEDRPAAGRAAGGRRCRVRQPTGTGGPAILAEAGAAGKTGPPQPFSRLREKVEQSAGGGERAQRVAFRSNGRQAVWDRG